MAGEAVKFIVAASIHRGFLFPGYQHQAASIGESVIASVLFIALLLTWIRPANTRVFGLVGQGFAFLGTLVGLFTIPIGVGPRTVPDVTYHVLILAVLAWGLIVTYRAVPNKRAASYARRLIRRCTCANSAGTGALPWADRDVQPCRDRFDATGYPLRLVASDARPEPIHPSSGNATRWR